MLKINHPNQSFFVRCGIFLPLVFVFLIGAGQNSKTQVGEQRLPILKKMIRTAEHARAKKNLGPEEVAYQVQDNYYQILYKMEQLSISNEVREHFEKAVKKSEEKFAEGEEDISQSAITKLKLGLAGTLNDIITLNADLARARLSLGHLMDSPLPAGAAMPEDTIKPVEFAHQDFDAFLQSLSVNKAPASGVSGSEAKQDSGCAATQTRCSGKITRETRLSFHKGFIAVNETRGQLQLAQYSRKITRTLLVTEAANYDFGIGDTADLFEALIIYTRVLRGYYEAVYNFNMAVAALDRAVSRSG